MPDIATELARADLVVVPVRYGSGTRLKILEAFAQRMPVVSTTLGAEGLGAEDGVHLLLGDTAPALAEACARLLREPALRQAVVSRAQELFCRAVPERGHRSRIVARLARGWPADRTGDRASRARRPPGPAERASLT